MLKSLMKNTGKIMLIILLLQVAIITLAVIFATPVGVWVAAEFSLTITSPILHFMLGALFFWVAASIASTIIGAILTIVIWIMFFKDWKNI